MKHSWMIAGLALASLVSVSLAAPAHADKTLERMMRGESALQGKKLDKAIAKAEAHPLGSLENPVRAAMPQGQRAYLAQLRCSDGAAPAFQRTGNVGVGVFGNIIDHYVLRCATGAPAEASVYMDMYHLGHSEPRAVPGFTMADAGVKG